jgi:hypothetical protein
LAPDDAVVVNENDDQSKCWMGNRVQKMHNCMPMIDHVVCKNNRNCHSKNSDASTRSTAIQLNETRQTSKEREPTKQGGGGRASLPYSDSGPTIETKRNNFSSFDAPQKSTTESFQWKKLTLNWEKNLQMPKSVKNLKFQKIQNWFLLKRAIPITETTVISSSFPKLITELLAQPLPQSPASKPGRHISLASP